MSVPAPGRVDAHHHLWDLDVRDQDWIRGAELAPIRRSFSVGDLESEARPVGIERTVVVQTVTVPEETPELLALAERHDLIGAVVGWADLTAPGVADDLARLVEGPGGRWLRGIRHQVQGEPDDRWLCRDDVQRGLAAVDRAGLVYELLTLPHRLPAAIETVAHLPEVRFVLDHCSKPPIATGELEPWASRLRALASHENVVCKLSGLVTEADWHRWDVPAIRPYADVVLEAFGPGRVLFGSDWPVCLLAASYDQVVALTEELVSGLAAGERDAVLGGTARAVYGIDRAQGAGG